MKLMPHMHACHKILSTMQYTNHTIYCSTQLIGNYLLLPPFSGQRTFFPWETIYLHIYLSLFV